MPGYFRDRCGRVYFDNGMGQACMVNRQGLGVATVRPQLLSEVSEFPQLQQMPLRYASNLNESRQGQPCTVTLPPTADLTTCGAMFGAAEQKTKSAQMARNYYQNNCVSKEVPGTYSCATRTYYQNPQTKEYYSVENCDCVQS